MGPVDMNLGKVKDVEGQGSMLYCSPWHLKESAVTWRLNNKVLLVTNLRTSKREVRVPIF